MRRRLLVLTMLLFALTVQPVMAVSRPPITGQVFLLEWCAQGTCGAANFAGSFTGSVEGKFRVGSAKVAVTHSEPLPTTPTDPPARITGGTWEIRLPEAPFRDLPARRFSGVLTPGGTVTANGNNTFTVVGTLVLTQGGTGTLNFGGVLDHNRFPPVLRGSLTQ